MFDDIHVRTAIVNGDNYVNVMDLASHLAAALFTMHAEVADEWKAGSILPRDYIFANGMVEGVREVAIMLTKGEMENRLHREVNTVDDLAKFC